MTDDAKLFLHRAFCTACGAVAIWVFVMWFVGMERGEFWGASG